MKNIINYSGRLVIITRLPSSKNGNPRWLLAINQMIVRTAPDSSLGYTVSNLDGKVVNATVGEHYGKITLNSVEEI